MILSFVIDDYLVESPAGKIYVFVQLSVSASSSGANAYSIL